MKRGQKAVSGVYEVRAPDGTSQPVLCDMLTDGGGWTVSALWLPSAAPSSGTFEESYDIAIFVHVFVGMKYNFDF